MYKSCARLWDRTRSSEKDVLTGALARELLGLGKSSNLIRESHGGKVGIYVRVVDGPTVPYPDLA